MANTNATIMSRRVKRNLGMISPETALFDGPSSRAGESSLKLAAHRLKFLNLVIGNVIKLLPGSLTPRDGPNRNACVTYADVDTRSTKSDRRIMLSSLELSRKKVSAATNSKSVVDNVLGRLE